MLYAKRSSPRLILSSVYLDIQESIKFSDRSVRNPEELFGIDFQNHFITMMGIMIEKGEIYNRAINQIEIIIELIDEELK